MFSRQHQVLLSGENFRIVFENFGYSWVILRQNRNTVNPAQSDTKKSDIG